MFRKLCSAVLCTLLLGSIGTVAQAQDSCDTVLLQRNVTSAQENLYMALSWMQLIDSENYEANKEEASALVPGYFDGDYEQFSEKRSKLRTETQFNLDLMQSRSLLQSRLDDDAVAAWETCMANRGLYARIVHIQADAAIVELYFDPDPGIERLNDVSVDLVSTADVDAGRLLELGRMNRGSRSFTVSRTANSSILGVINGEVGRDDNPYQTNFRIPPVYTPSPLQKLSSEPTIYRSGNGECSGMTELITRDAPMEVLVVGKAQAYSNGHGQIGVNVHMNGSDNPICGSDMLTQHKNMGVSSPTCKIELNPYTWYNFEARQKNINADCRGTMIQVLK